MKETQEDIDRLQAVLDASIERAGTFLRRSFQMPEHSLSAIELIQELQGIQWVALATVTAKSEPRVAPIGALFYHGDFYIPTVATAARTRHIMKRPSVSLTYFMQEDLAIIVHGSATVITPEHPIFETLEELMQTYNNSKASTWGEGIYLHIHAETIYTYIRYPNTQANSAIEIRPLTAGEKHSMFLASPSKQYKDTFLEGLQEEVQAEGDQTSRNIQSYAADFGGFLQRFSDMERGINISPHLVPASSFWLIDNGEYIGSLNLRHELNDHLFHVGGHIGYDIRPSKRKKGYGKEILRLGLEKARERGLRRVLITCDETNIGSRKIIEVNGGIFENAVTQEGSPVKKLRYWINIS